MIRSNVGSLIVACFSAATIAGCSEQPILEPATDIGAARAGDVGTYQISFHTSSSHVEHVPSAPVGTELGVRATVRNSSGALVTVGQVTFERCTLNGSPAPSASCDSGAGIWKRYFSMSMDPSGYPPTVSGGRCENPATHGWRFRYNPKGGSIAAGTSQSRDFSWVAVE